MQIEYIHYFSRKLLSRYSLYLIGFFLSVGLIIFGVFFFYAQYHEALARIKKAQQQQTELQKKKDLIEFKGQASQTIRDPARLQQLNEFLNQLIPSKENYFSIIAALEKLSQKTNFIITSYSINLNDSSEGKLALDITCQGDTATFL